MVKFVEVGFSVRVFPRFWGDLCICNLVKRIVKLILFRFLFEDHKLGKELFDEIGRVSLTVLLCRLFRSLLDLLHELLRVVISEPLACADDAGLLEVPRSVRVLQDLSYDT